MNWYGWAALQGKLPKRQRPTGNNVVAPMAGIPYRVPLSTEGHIIGYDQIHEDDPVFLCGRSVRIDERWYRLSGASAIWGEDLYLVADTRVSGQCSACKTGWKQELERRKYEASLTGPRSEPSAISNEEYAARLGVEWMKEDMELATLAVWVAQLFDGEVVT